MMRWTFGSVELDTSRAELRVGGEVVPIEPQVFDVLWLLIEHRDRVVTHRELMESVWRDRIVGPAALASRIKAARRAVGDDGRRQAVIATVHGTGYRFVADVHAVDGTDPPPEQVLEAVELVESRRPIRPHGRELLVDEVVDRYAARDVGIAFIGPSQEAELVVADVADRVADRFGATCERTVGSLPDVALGSVAHLLDHLPVAPSGDDDLDRVRVLRVALDDVVARWAGRPLPLFVVHDRDALDPMSRALVDLVTQRRAAFVIEMAGAGHPSPDLVRRHLAPLDTSTMRRLAEQILGGGVSERLGNDVTAAAGGSATRALDIVVASRDAGRLARVDGTWTVTSGLVSAAPAYWPPADVGPDSVRAAELVAVAGHMSVSLLERLVGRSVVDDLDERRIVSVSEQDPVSIRITSPVVRTAIVAAITPLRRERLLAQLRSVDQDGGDGTVTGE